MLNSKQANTAPMVLVGVSTTVYGVTIYYLLPLALLSMNLNLVSQIIIFILVGLLFALTLRFGWALLTRVVVADSWVTSVLILTAWALHEAEIISLPLLAARTRKLAATAVGRLLDVTGDGKFDMDDVEVLVARARNRLSGAQREDRDAAAKKLE